MWGAIAFASNDRSTTSDSEGNNQMSEKPEIDFPGGEPPADLEVTDLAVGDGAEARAGRQVLVHYVGVDFETGEEFDSSWNRGEPIKFPLQRPDPGLAGRDPRHEGRRPAPARRARPTRVRRRPAAATGSRARPSSSSSTCSTWADRADTARAMAESKTERLLQVVLCLTQSRRYVTKDQLRDAIPDYAACPTAEAFERMFERDKNELRELGIPLETGSTGVVDDDPGYRIDRDAYALPPLHAHAATS